MTREGFDLLDALTPTERVEIAARARVMDMTPAEYAVASLKEDGALDGYLYEGHQCYVLNTEERAELDRLKAQS